MGLLSVQQSLETRQRRRVWQGSLGSLALVLLVPNLGDSAVSAQHADPYAITSGITPPPFLRMPRRAEDHPPRLLSQTGVFADTRNLIPSAGIIPYDLVVAFWSDGARKQRWASIPKASIAFENTGDWTFAAGTVFVKNFELPIDARDPTVKRRLETRLLVRDDAGGVYGVVYKWRPDNSDAELLTSSVSEQIPITTIIGETATQTWYYPSPRDCLECHNSNTTGVLGASTRQLNRNFQYPSGITANELRTWNQLGLFRQPLKDQDFSRFPKMASADDPTRTLEDRARSYLDANCAQCHRPGGTVANFDARYDTPLEKQALINGPVIIDERIDHSRVIAPNDIWRSIAFIRTNTVGDVRMPPIARETIDEMGVAVLRQWIMSLPGRPVVQPPEISPPGGTYVAPVSVSIQVGEPGADIRYTLDGSAPTAADSRYEAPIRVSRPTVIRARAFKDGFVRSIETQGVYLVGQ